MNAEGKSVERRALEAVATQLGFDPDNPEQAAIIRGSYAYAWWRLRFSLGDLWANLKTVWPLSRSGGSGEV